MKFDLGIPAELPSHLAREKRSQERASECRPVSSCCTSYVKCAERLTEFAVIPVRSMKLLQTCLTCCRLGAIRNGFAFRQTG